MDQTSCCSCWSLLLCKPSRLHDTCLLRIKRYFGSILSTLSCKKTKSSRKRLWHFHHPLWPFHHLGSMNLKASQDALPSFALKVMQYYWRPKVSWKKGDLRKIFQPGQLNRWLEVLTDLKSAQPSGSCAFGNVFSISYLRRFCKKKCSDNVKHIHQF